MKKILTKLIRIKLFFSFIKFYFKSQNKAEVTLLIPRLSMTYFLRTNFLWDLATMMYLSEIKKTYKVRIGLKEISKISSSKVIYNPGYNLNDWKVDNDVAFFPLISSILENQSNEVIPTSKEISFWENKFFMYQKFIEKNIEMPSTHVIQEENLKEILNKIDLKDSKWLYKPNHSKSSIGIVEIKSDFESFIKEKLKLNKYVVIQKIINIKRDCRIIVINDEIVLQYWRNKVESEGWIPTSTSTGSTVTFMEYPESLKKWVIESTNKLGLRSAAWDIVFDEEDLNQENPLALEVSPIYYPNPRENYSANESYASYKNNLNYEKYLLNEFKTHIKAKLKPWVEL
ncbi:hypothetical protein F7018_17315 [Tenacibaculum aiptasiae]|uniref:ATP-grasp fold RimK-type domain-containing protein n=1 Tax=Tenacibaculum aiptasiae TaxID=426481 RepID=A0A7J5A6U6_9FLAO|nr:hypothetical protein [Tenacibaculum aiptasiae]KAB1153280.1 hypothetical protein F7018_17315 [Tenacibaculum aiptasiae]